MKHESEFDYPFFFEKALQMAKDLNVPVVFSKITHPTYKRACGVYWNETKSIQINTDIYNIARPSECLVFTLVHEIVHAVQHILGAYETFDWPDDLDEIRKNEVRRAVMMEEAPIYEIEADTIAGKILESWGMYFKSWTQSYLTHKRLKGENAFKKLYLE